MFVAVYLYAFYREISPDREKLILFRELEQNIRGEKKECVKFIQIKNIYPSYIGRINFKLLV